MAETNAATLALLRRHRGRVRTITADNGSEVHGDAELEKASGVKFYIATPHHAWERGTSENTNGLIRLYLPKRTNLTELTAWKHAPGEARADPRTQEVPVQNELLPRRLC